MTENLKKSIFIFFPFQITYLVNNDKENLQILTSENLEADNISNSRFSSVKVKQDIHTLIDDDPLHSLFELVGGAEAFNSPTQHPLLLRQPALQSGYLILQQLILMSENRRMWV